ncbi:hypothetical protein EJB05_02504, partial [Eragrostis curvula]
MEQPEGEASGSTDEERTPSPPPPPPPSPALSAASSGSIHASPTSHSPAQLPPPKQPVPAVDANPMEQSEREEADSNAAADEVLSPPPSPPPSPALSAETSPTSRSASRQPLPKKLAPGAVIARDGTGTLEQEVMDSAAVGGGLRSPTPPPAPRTTCLDPSSSKGVNSAVAPPLPNGGVVINGEGAADDPVEQPKREAADEPRSPTPPPPPAPPSTTPSFVHAALNSSSAGPSQPTGQNAASAEHNLAPMAKANGVPGDSSSPWTNGDNSGVPLCSAEQAANEKKLLENKELSSQSEQIENEHKADVPLCMLEQFVSENKCLKEKVTELTAQKEKAENELKEKEDDLKRREDAVLLDRLLYRERKVKDAETAARVQWFTQTRHHQGDNAEGSSGAPASADLAMLQLIYPLLQPTQQSALTPIPTDRAPAALPSAAPKAEDDMWDKRQIGYVFYLGLAVALLILVRPLLPHVFDRIFLAVFAAIWGLGSIGLPLGIFGTSRFEKDCSRHIGRFIALCFSLMVIYAAYLLALKPLDAHGTSPSPPPLADVDDNVILWRVVFGFIGLLVSACHVTSWIAGCCTGGDRDLLP